MKRQSLLTVGIAHATRVGATRAIYDTIKGNDLQSKVIKGILVTIAFHFITKFAKRTYTPVDPEIIDVEIIE